MVRVSIVIPCYNPTGFLREALASVWAQTSQPAEVILVNDGSDHPESLRLLDSLAARVSRRIDQQNLGPAAARNAGVRAASGDFIVPLDADDRLAASFIAECAAAFQAHPEAAFVYSDYRVFGDARYRERLGEYNLYSLLERNTIPYAAMIRRAGWELSGGQDESLRVHYEDWDFWLRLGERDRFGYHLPRVLFDYRKSGRSQFTRASEQDEAIRAKIRSATRGFIHTKGAPAVKARWAPAVRVLAPDVVTEPVIADWQQLAVQEPRTALERSTAGAFLIPAAGARGDAHDGELCALAVWGGKAVTQLPDGTLCVSRTALASAEQLRRIGGQGGADSGSPACPNELDRPMEQIHRHLVNAELTSPANWLRHPRQSLGRLIPLRAKERVNRALGRPLFDLSFYLKFQMQSVLVTDAIVPLLRYMPPRAQRHRIGLVNPHLGPGGAESVLLELAGAIDRRRHEVFMLATQSQDSRWRSRWEEVADHVYDLASLARPDRMVAALCSVAANWGFETLVVQNSLAAYSAIPHLRKDLPGLRIIDMIHAVDRAWDFVSSTADVAPQIDLRVVISAAGRERLLAAGVAAEKVRLIRNGVDLERFRAAPLRAEEARRTILFAGRLDAVKRPLLLVEIAGELRRLRGGLDFRIVVAGDGPEGDALRGHIRRAQLDSAFELRGQVSAMPAVLADADVVVLPSKAEGIPLIVIEAFAVARPVVCSRVGAVTEVVDASTGVLIEPGAGEAGRFAAALQRLLEDRGTREAMGQAGRRKVEGEYDLRKARAAYHDLVEE